MAITVTERWSGYKMTRAGSAWIGERAFDVVFTEANVPGSPSAALDTVYGTYTLQMNTQVSVSGASIYLRGASVAAHPIGLGVYEVIFTYSTSPEGHFFDPANPLSEPYEYVWEPGNTSEQVDQDSYGNPISNTNGDVVENLPSRYFGLLYLTIRKNVAAFSLATSVTYQDTVNSSDWTFGPAGGTWTIGAGMALCKAIRPMTGITVASQYVRLEHQFEIRFPFAGSKDSDGLWDSWKHRVVNAGKRCFYTNGDATSPGYGNTALGEIIFKGGNQIIKASEDVRLASNGTPIDTTSFAVNGIGSQTPVAHPGTFPTSIVVDTATTGIVYLKYRMYPGANFNTLSL